MRDSATGRSRGFGFLTFRDPKTVNTVMVKEHYLDGKIVSYTSHILKVLRQSEAYMVLRSIRSVQSLVTNKKRQAKSSLVASAKKLTSKTSNNFLCNSVVWSMLL